jgi:hypothetical protein
MGMSGAQTETDQLRGRGLITKPGMISHSGGASGNRRSCRSRNPILRQRDEDRGLADMLLDSFHVPRVMPPRLSALVALLKTPIANAAPGNRGP